MIPAINHGEVYFPFLNIAQIEKQRNAKFVCELSIMAKGGWSRSPAQIYYQEVPPVEGYSHYFAIVPIDGKAYITSGESVDGIPIAGIITASGEIIYSRCGHDFRTAKSAEVSIDGGIEYTRIIGNPSDYKRVVLTLKKGEMVLVTDPNEIKALEINKQEKMKRSSGKE